MQRVDKWLRFSYVRRLKQNAHVKLRAIKKCRQNQKRARAAK